MNITTAMMRTRIPMIRKGTGTDWAAICAGFKAEFSALSATSLKTKMLATIGARVVAIEFRACVRFNLPEAVSEGPSAVT